MKKNYLRLDYGQHLEDIIKHLVSNRIYFKILPGIGATTLEIKTKRWSIIIEPNVPVIIGKKKQHKQILGVYEGVDTGDVIAYLKNDKIKHKKILVTPESFIKVKKACEVLLINIYKEFFLLFDECDRTMKDVKFRDSIIYPMEDFFYFEQKAFISATAVIPTDPRFEEQGFELEYIKPTFDYKKEIDVIISNNVSLAIKSVINENSDRTVCVFLNSVNAIRAIIADLNIKTQSSIFCSYQKKLALKARGYNAFEHIDAKDFKIVNFLTSRFNSAVDIPLDENPVVILATNLYYANYTMIDPSSEAVQIVGRFRNGVDKVYAILNVNDEMQAKTPSEAVSFLSGCEQSYNDIKTLKNSTAIPGARETLEEALQFVKYSKFINEDGTKNHYMYDNFLYEEAVKMIFESKENVIQAYESQYFEPVVSERNYIVSDSQYKIAKDGVSTFDLVNAVVTAIRGIQQNGKGLNYVIDNREVALKEIELSFPDIYKAYFMLGETELLKNAYSKRHILKAIKIKREFGEKTSFSFINDLHEAFPDGYEATTAVIKAVIKELIAKNGLILKAEIKLLSEYFVLSSRRSMKGNQDAKGYKILSSKFNRKGQ